MNLIGIKSVWRSGKPDEWGHLAVAVEIDAEVDVVGIKIDRSRESRRVTKGCLKNPIGDGHTFGFAPHSIIVGSRCTRGHRTPGREETKKKCVASIRHIGSIGIDHLPLEIDLPVDTGSRFSKRSNRESAHEKYECCERVHRFPSPNAKHSFCFRKKKTDASFLATRLLYISIVAQKNALVKP